MSNGHGFLSRLARRIVRGLVRFYYPNIEISGAERLPASGPLLLAANHQNSLMDPVMVGIVARRPVRFLAKAPLFQIPIFGNILHALGMLPAYRRADDPTQTRRNLESLSLAAARLKDGEAVGIFPEGKSHDAPRIEAVKTGAARMAIQAVREGATGLKLVPLGLNYERKEMFRSAVWVRVGEPINVNAWLANFTRGDKQTTRHSPLSSTRSGGEGRGEEAVNSIESVAAIAHQPSSPPALSSLRGRRGSSSAGIGGRAEGR